MKNKLKQSFIAMCAMTLAPHAVAETVFINFMTNQGSAPNQNAMNTAQAAAIGATVFQNVDVQGTGGTQPRPINVGGITGSVRYADWWQADIKATLFNGGARPEQGFTGGVVAINGTHAGTNPAGNASTITLNLADFIADHITALGYDDYRVQVFYAGRRDAGRDALSDPDNTIIAIDDGTNTFADHAQFALLDVTFNSTVSPWSGLGAVHTFDSSATALTINVSPVGGTTESGVAGILISPPPLETGVEVVWTGALGSEWSTAVLDAPKNWVLADAPGTPADFGTGDAVRFDDSATGTTIAITAGDVIPAGMVFDHTTNHFLIEGPGGISGPGGLMKSGGGTLTLATTNTYSGATEVDDGTIVVADPLALSGSTVAGIFNFGDVVFGAVDNAVFGGLAGDADLLLASNETIPQPVALTVGGNGFATSYGGEISGPGSLIKTGAGSLVLNLGSTFSGGSTITGGFVQMQDPVALGTGPVVHDGGQVRFSFGNGSDVVVENDFVLRPTGHQTFVIRGNNDAAPTIPTTVTLDGKISGGAAGQLYRLLDTLVALNHNNVLVLANAGNDFEGTIEMWRGTLAITSDGALGNPANGIRHFTENLNGAIRFDAPDITLNPLREINFPGSTNVRPIHTQSFDARINGPVTGNAIMVKRGNGTLTLAGNTSFTGTARIDEGTLALDGDARLDAVTTIDVASGAVFDISAVQSNYFLASFQTITGNGTIAGDLEVVGTLSPGGASGIGTLTHQGGVLLDQATIALQFDSRTGLADRVIIDGDIDVDTFATLQISDLATAPDEETMLPNATKLVLVEYTGDFGADFLDINVQEDVPDGSTVTIGMNEFVLSYDDPDLAGGAAKFITLTVPGEAPAGYATWAAANAGGQAPELDFDGDGVPNGVEYFIGETGTSFTQTPQVVSDGNTRTITWPRDPAANASFAIETSTTMNAGEWTTITPPDASIDISDPTQVVFTLPDDTPSLFVRLVVTVDP